MATYFAQEKFPKSANRDQAKKSSVVVPILRHPNYKRRQLIPDQELIED
jgi:hypothetical protein